MNSTQSGHEEWRPVPIDGAPYEVSNEGTVRTIPHTVTRSNGATQFVKSTVRKQSSLKSGHLRVRLIINGKGKHMLVHRLVLMAFVGPCPEGMEGCHNNGDPADNRLSNLRWDSRAANIYDMVRHGSHPKTKKTHCLRGHALELPNLTEESIEEGHRTCLACARATSYLFKHKGMADRIQEVADQYYNDILRYGPHGQHRCKRGHALVPANISSWDKRDGRRRCMCCIKARKLKKTNPNIDIKMMADKFYREIVTDD